MEVKAAAVLCMTASCNCTGNRDLEPFRLAVRSAAQSIDNTHAVECPALAATLAVLACGLTTKSEEMNHACQTNWAFECGRYQVA